MLLEWNIDRGKKIVLYFTYYNLNLFYIFEKNL